MSTSVSAPNSQTTADVTETEPAPPAWENERQPGPWAVVEIMGHQVRAGSISDATIGGAVMLRIQHPTVPDHYEHDPLTEFYSPSALFSIRPCTRREATRWAENRWRSSRPTPAIAELDAARDVYVDDENDWDEQEPFEP